MLKRIACVILAIALAACSTGPPPAVESPAPSPAPGAKPDAASPRAAEARPKIVVLGDSLSAGLGLNPSQAFPSLLQKRLDEAGHRYEVVNAGVSGDTSAGGLRRLDWAIEGDARVLVVELGANDGLRGLPVAEMKKNLSAIITRAKARGITVIVAGMEAPPNYGEHYTQEFREAYSDLAREHDVALIPFLLDGVAGIRALNQGDGIHPNPEGARLVERIVWRALEPVLDSPAGAGPPASSAGGRPSTGRRP